MKYFFIAYPFIQIFVIYVYKYIFYLSLINKDKLKLIICSKQKIISLQPILLYTYIESFNSLFPLFNEILNF